MTLRPTVRLRLTAWYASIFFVAGAVLLGASYFIVSRNLARYNVQVEEQLSQRLGEALREIVPEEEPLSLPAPDRVSPETERRIAEAEARIQREVTAEERGELRRRIGLQYLAVLGLMTLGSVAAGYAVAGRALRPVSRITEAAKRVNEGRLDERIGLKGPRDELKELADTFDSMLGRLDAAFASQRNFVANASHELRTPLAVMRTALEVTLESPAPHDPAELGRMADTVREAIGRSERLTESLLLLAQSDRGLAKRVPLDLAELAAEALVHLEPLARARGVGIGSRLDPARAEGEPELVQRLVENLVENAIRHNREDGGVEIATGSRKDCVYLRVENDGEIVSVADPMELCEPFRRDGRERRREGFGLGLSIARSVAEAHGGTLELAKRAEGGLVAEFRLPTG
jgi:signal transduction histidine kinase